MAKTDNKKKKLLMIGIDGGDWSIIDPLLKNNSLPNIAKLIKNGTRSHLKSTIPYQSPTAWSTFITGTNPGKHAVYDFFSIDNESYDMVFSNASHRKGKSFWHNLNGQGLTVGVINVPFTYPPEKINGFMISGMDTPGKESPYTYPENLKNEIQDKFSQYIIDTHLTEIPDHKNMQVNELLKIFKDSLFKMIKLRGQVTRDLMKTKDWDVMITVFTASDRAQHHYWKYYSNEKNGEVTDESEKSLGQVIPAVYEKIDREIGKILEISGQECNVIIFSDHGAGPAVRIGFINNWLKQEGYLNLKKIPLKSKGLQLGRKIAKAIPKEFKETLKKSLPKKNKQLQSSIFSSHIDWSNSYAFGEGFNAALYLNVKGKKPQGVIEPGKQYEKIRQEIIEKLKKLKDPATGKCPLIYVLKKEELYSGDHLDKAPDIIIVPESGYQLVGELMKMRHTESQIDYDSDLFFDIPPEHRISGIHELYGILIMHGPDIKQNFTLPASSIVDLTPTVLHLCDTAIPSEMDGRVLEEALIEKKEIKTAESGEIQAPEKDRLDYNDREKEIVAQRLRDLGYL